MNGEQRINYALALDTQKRLKERIMPKSDPFIDADPKAYLTHWLDSYKKSEFPQTLSYPSDLQKEALMRAFAYERNPARNARDATTGIEDMKSHYDKPKASR